MEPRKDVFSRAPLGMINVILVASGRTSSHPSKVMSIAWPPTEDSNHESKRAKMEIRPVLSFSDENKVRTIQPHNDPLVVTLRIEGYDVNRVLVDQGSGTEIMYPDLYKGLNLKPEDLTCYDSPLLGFDVKVVIPRVRLDYRVGRLKGGGGGGLYCDTCLFSLHSHCSLTLASCLRGCFFHPLPESEISIRESD